MFVTRLSVTMTFLFLFLLLLMLSHLYRRYRIVNSQLLGVATANGVAESSPGTAASHRS